MARIRGVDWEDRPEKRKITQQLCEQVLRFDRGLLLPGAQLGCMKALTARGAIDRDTFLYLVEREQEVVDVIRRRLLRQAAKTYVHVGDLEDIDLLSLLADSPSFDFMYIDTCSPLTRNLAWWLMTQAYPMLRVGGQIAVTLTRCARHSGFPSPWLRWLKRQKFFKSTCGELGDLVADSEFDGKHTETTAALVTTMKVLFPRMSPTFCASYNDGTPMVTVLFDFTGAAPPPRQVIESLASQILTI